MVTDWHEVEPPSPPQGKVMWGPGILVIKDHEPMSSWDQHYYGAHGDQTAPGRQTDDLPPNSVARALEWP